MRTVVDAANVAAGRLASYAAKQALLGHEIIVVNSEKAVITGKTKVILEKYLEKRKRGGSAQKGPNFPSRAEFILKRTIRGMLAYKVGRGKEAFEKIKCFKGIPKEYEGDYKVKLDQKKKDGIQLEKLAGLLKK